MDLKWNLKKNFEKKWLSPYNYEKPNSNNMAAMCNQDFMKNNIILNSFV